MRTTKTFIAALALLLIAAAGCSVIRPGVPVELPQIVHDTVYHTTVQRDTIREVRHFKDTVIQRDSVFVKGETVYREKYIYKPARPTIPYKCTDTCAIPCLSTSGIV